MSRQGTHIREVRFDPKSRRFSGDVTFYEPIGSRSLRVSVPGHPAWDFVRTVAALTAAGARVARPAPISSAPLRS